MANKKKNICKWVDGNITLEKNPQSYFWGVDIGT